MIYGDLRQKEFRGRKIIFAEIVNNGFPPFTDLILHGKIPVDPVGRVVRMHKETVKRLRSIDAYRRGLILMTLYHDRPAVRP